MSVTSQQGILLITVNQGPHPLDVPSQATLTQVTGQKDEPRCTLAHKFSPRGQHVISTHIPMVNRSHMTDLISKAAAK